MRKHSPLRGLLFGRVRMPSSKGRAREKELRQRRHRRAKRLKQRVREAKQMAERKRGARG